MCLVLLAQERGCSKPAAEKAPPAHLAEREVDPCSKITSIFKNNSAICKQRLQH